MHREVHTMWFDKCVESLFLKTRVTVV